MTPPLRELINSKPSSRVTFLGILAPSSNFSNSYLSALVPTSTSDVPINNPINLTFNKTYSAKITDVDPDVIHIITDNSNEYYMYITDPINKSIKYHI